LQWRLQANAIDWAQYETDQLLHHRKLVGMGNPCHGKFPTNSESKESYEIFLRTTETRPKPDPSRGKGYKEKLAVLRVRELDKLTFGLLNPAEPNLNSEKITDPPTKSCVQALEKCFGDQEYPSQQVWNLQFMKVVQGVIDGKFKPWDVSLNPQLFRETQNEGLRPSQYITEEGICEKWQTRPNHELDKHQSYYPKILHQARNAPFILYAIAKVMEVESHFGCAKIVQCLMRCSWNHAQTMNAICIQLLTHNIADYSQDAQWWSEPELLSDFMERTQYLKYVYTIHSYFKKEKENELHLIAYMNKF
jgi:hypothetical protein